MDEKVADNAAKDSEPAGTDGNAAKTHRDLQRRTLQELIDLARACADQEIQIEARLSGSVAEAQGLDQRTQSDLNRAVKTSQEQTEKKYEQKLSQIESTYQQSVANIKTQDANARGRAEGEFEAVQEDIKQKFSQAMWLAESVLEAAEGKVADDLKKATELHASQDELLNMKQAEAEALMARYNQPLPPALAVERRGAGGETPSFETDIATVEDHLKRLGDLSVPGLFIGARPHLVVMGILALAVGIPQLAAGSIVPQWKGLGIGVGSAAVICTVGLILLRRVARKQVLEAYAPLKLALDSARIDNNQSLERASMERDVELAKAIRHNKAEKQGSRDRAAPILEKAAKRKDAALAAAKEEFDSKSNQFASQRKNALDDLEQWRVNKLAEATSRHAEAIAQNSANIAEKIAAAKKRRSDERVELENRWREGLARIQAPMREEGAVPMAWDDPRWGDWNPPTKFPQTIRFGEMQVDLKSIIAEVAKAAPFTLPLPQTFCVPALMAFPRQASMMIHTDREGRAASSAAMRMILSRLLTSLPAGRVRFTLIDPVSLGQSFAGFMHLADYDEALVGVRIWTDSEHIDQRLANLTEHMETVIQKYLRNEFETIDDYNAQAGELAEPYRFLVISDFPVNFSEEALRRLSSIATTGARCGVYTLIMRDLRVGAQAGTHLDDLQAHSINLIRQGDRFVWRDEVFQRFPLAVDPAPGEEELTRLLHRVGAKAKEANRVEVPFESIAPQASQFWTLKSAGDLQVAIGRMGATRLQMFRLGRGVAQHALIAGKTGSGKSTLLHALISNLAMWYSPEEIELYLIDFKKGVEFKTYAEHRLPHARAIAVESDREFGLSVLQRLDAELTRRGDLYRQFGVQDLASYRDASGKSLPRTLLVIDEFQEFFSEDDKLAQDAGLLLDRLVRQGRAFGVHVLLGSQTIGGSSGLSRSTIGQIAVRIALQTSEADSQLILGDGNSAARLLSRPGEAIYNDAGGLVEGNSPFQVAWLPDERRDVFLEAVNAKAAASGIKTTAPIVFEGNAPADYRENPILKEELAAAKYEPLARPPIAWLGDPVAIKNPTGVALRRQSGGNILIVGQHEDAALAMACHAMIGLAAQLSPAEGSFVLIDGTPADSPTAGVLERVAGALPHQTRVVAYRDVGGAVHDLALELQKRQENEGNKPAAIFVIIFGLQRFRALRKSDDAFSFNSADEPKPPDPGKEFADLLREGPAHGIHVIAWIDTAMALDRALDRTGVRELDNRVLFQMSATDSSNLIDSPAANKLGAHRALVYSEEQGTMEKFRPYALPDAAWLEEVRKRLSAKTDQSSKP
jgi:DNA segregation ATPase FtsK/SpoIIIE, S-DNA-T family